MNFYPMQKFMKDMKEKQDPSNQPATLSRLKSFELPPDENPDNGNGTLGSIGSLSPSRRHDRAFTLSWANKQYERRVEFLRQSPVNKSLSKVPNTITESPLTKKNRSYVVHLASEADNKMHKVPLYDKDVFEMRKQNERILKQIISNKQAHQQEFDRIAENNRFKQFRSVSYIPKAIKPLFSDKSPEKSPEPNGRRDSKNSLQLSIIRPEPGKINEDYGDALSQPYTNEDLSLSTVTSKAKADKSRLLEGLEEMYKKDLQKRIELKEKPVPLSPKKGESKSQAVLEKEEWILRNYKNYFNDDKLMKRLEDPYSNKLPFEKPVVASFRHEVLRELHSIETKAQVLRTIKSIDDSMVKEAGLTEEPEKQKILIVNQQEKRRVNGRKDTHSLGAWAKYINSRKNLIASLNTSNKVAPK